MRKPDFERNLLRKEKPDRATLFELFLTSAYYERLAGHRYYDDTRLGCLRTVAEAMAAAGYDYAPAHGSDFHYITANRKAASSISLNGGLITDWASFEKYQWLNPEDYDYSSLEKITPYLPDGMKVLAECPSGVLENVMQIVGYDNLCIMLYEEPELVETIFNHVGERMVKYAELCIGYDSVGFFCSNDDWGFNTQTFLSPADMRKYVFPWHKKIVELCHRHGKPCMLHSCGYYGEVIEDIIADMQFDARHSYEDNIVPVEKAYDDLKGRIAVLGGIDMDYIISRTPEEIYKRSRAMLEKAQDGGYALGSGNSIPDYVPFEHFLALNRAALDMD